MDEVLFRFPSFPRNMANGEHVVIPVPEPKGDVSDLIESSLYKAWGILSTGPENANRNLITHP